MPDDESINGTEDRLPRRADLRRATRHARRLLSNRGVQLGMGRKERRLFARNSIRTSDLYPKQ